MPSIIRSINDNIRKCEEELALLGQPMPVDDAGKLTKETPFAGMFVKEADKHVIKDLAERNLLFKELKSFR